MKKETVILYVVIALVVGFVGGATVGILWMTKGTEKTAMVQKPPMTPPGAPAPCCSSSSRFYRSDFPDPNLKRDRQERPEKSPSLGGIGKSLF